MSSQISLCKIEYFDTILVIDFAFIIFMQFLPNPDKKHQIVFGFGDSGSTMTYLVESEEDKDGEILQEKFLDTYTQWRNFQKKLQPTEVYLET